MVRYFSQGTGQISRNGQIVPAGYSGKGAGRKNPRVENLPNVGPIPRGRYNIGPVRKHPTTGAVTVILTPLGHRAHGPSALLIHEDNHRHPGAASEGCIILPSAIRKQIANSNDTTMEVGP